MEIIGYIAAFCTTVSFLPQLIQTLKTKNTTGISLVMYVIFVFGVTMWLLYGILKEDWPLIIANSFTWFFSFTILAMKVRATLRGQS
ncbi:MAG: MtN3 and saliva related transmembrane protein [Cyclobacteriaceae bacterium]|jgi:MtN3 and saliva related transmembrane protein